MKKTCLALLAASALPTFAALDIASVDIEGIKLGMKGEEAAAIVKGYCEKEKNGKYKEEPMSLNNVNFNAYVCDENKLGALLLDSKAVLIATEQKIELNDPNDKDFVKNWQLAVRKKTTQKYGEPTLDVSDTIVILIGQESYLLQRLLCWEGCKKQSSESDKNILEVNDQALIIGLNTDKNTATIIRMLIDETTIAAAQKEAPKTEAEKAAAKVNL